MKRVSTIYSYFGARYYDSDLSVWLSVDPMSDERSWISPYNYCQWNPVGRVDPSGALDWHPDINGDLVADPGDNEFTLTNYIWRKAGVIVPYDKSKQMIQSIGNGEAVVDFTGETLRLTTVKKYAGDHVATMLNPGTRMVHEGQNNFLFSAPVQLAIKGMMFLLPVSQGARIIMQLENATIAESSKFAAEFMFKVLPELWFAVDQALGGENLQYGNIPSQFLFSIGYQNLAEYANKGRSSYNVIKNIKSGDFSPIGNCNDLNNIINGREQIIEGSENIGYPN